MRFSLSFILGVCLAVVTTAAPAFAADCALAPGSVLTIGCTVGCGAEIRERIQRSATALGYRVRFTGLAGRDAHGVDAILSPGGKDIDPKLYLSSVSPGDRARVLDQDRRRGKHTPESLARDAFEYRLFQDYFSDEAYRDVPALGICYGSQMLAVSRGLPMVIDLKEELGIPARYDVDDLVTPEPGSLLDRLGLGGEVAEGGFRGREEHHQAVDIRAYRRLGLTGVRITATSNDGNVPEAAEYAGRSALGVQFHPEISSLAVSDAIFGWFLEKACEGRKNRDPAPAGGGAQIP